MTTDHLIDRPMDRHGVEHRPGCGAPGWVSNPSSLRGWFICRCSECGAVRLTRAGGAK